MRPDLVRVDMPTMPNSKKAVGAPLSGLGLTKTLNRRRRLAVEKGLRSNSNISYSSSSLRYSREADSQWFDPLQDQVPQTNLHFAANAFADRKLSQQPKENSDQPQWLGPTVVLLREDESFIEVADKLERLRSNTASGEDGIARETYKACVDTLVPWLHGVIEQARRVEVIPIDWGSAILFSVFKKGDKKKYENYCGVSLVDVAAKVFNLLILRRFQSVRDSRMRPIQALFRAGRGCVDQIFTQAHSGIPPWLPAADGRLLY
ncbi:unnamed protein product [Schistocephalus solidus]|uniref:ULP_PROTEASE domain-containing protein n=1 Tax=Schistocephalus solidus TaxID=70667 RepID=A0A183SXL0_SCHSO|nr:unnamed protein product [Schistocephalus solidus]